MVKSYLPIASLEREPKWKLRLQCNSDNHHAKVKEKQNVIFYLNK
jgi:hypothetical protein